VSISPTNVLADFFVVFHYRCPLSDFSAKIRRKQVDEGLNRTIGLEKLVRLDLEIQLNKVVIKGKHMDSFILATSKIKLLLEVCFGQSGAPSA